ncbi:MAG: phosphoribosylglycinamide formyltransferase [Bacteroidales bacterium]|nr:phosphoribosylglycinamide formyltransferase [Bacteroidales bacterium]MDD4656860.1 phosphoribosylglycinamide formyltransferase [Bacteroidales bacterium]
MKNINIAIFASGSGTNAQKIIEYIQEKRHLSLIEPYLASNCNISKTIPQIDVKLILSNKKEAYVLERARKLNIESFVFTPKELKEGRVVDNLLRKNSIDFIILAGFLVKFPERLVSEYDGRIINLHPSLLPKYGGKGMYGSMVHKAIIEAKERESGITIHLVDNEYDNGEHLFQIKCSVKPQETPESLAETIHKLEWEHFPRVICEYIIGSYLNGKYLKE